MMPVCIRGAQMNNPSVRSPIVDALKVIAPQLIVLHHLAFYGPMSDSARQLAPALFDWLANHARVAVQFFLVVGGFLAARSLAAGRHALVMSPLARIWQRYCRLVIPFLAAMALAIACAALARTVLPLASTPAAPGLLQLVAHLLLLQDILGFEALSAGVWYVAIDFQLYALLVALLWVSRRHAVAMVAALAAASLFYFNRIPAWDDWALYFFAAYAMGVLAFWASEKERPLGMLALMVAVVAAALVVDFRSRMVVALVTAVLLGMTYRRCELPPGSARPLIYMGDISYSVFLVHYPVCLVVNAAFGRLYPHDATANALGTLLAWGLSLVAGALFHRFVEKPAGNWIGRTKRA